MRQTSTNTLIDGNVFCNTSQRGIQRYLYELIANLTGDHTIIHDQPTAVPLPEGTPRHTRTEYHNLPKARMMKRAINKAKRLWFPTDYPAAGVWHTSYFGRNPIPSIPSSVVLHDMIPECFPYHFSGNSDREIAFKESSLKEASAIIAISRATKNALSAVYPELAQKTHVVYHGSDHLVSEVALEDRSIGSSPGSHPYVLFVGDRKGYKNFVAVLDAMQTRRWPSELKLRVVGNRPFSKGEQMALRYRGLTERITFLGAVDDRRLSHEYRFASAFVFPSLIEGFGFPLLEAQAHSTPVAASDTEVFREVGGDSFERFSPTDPESIASAIDTLLDTRRADELRNAGRLNCARFSWRSCAEKTQSIWESIAT